MVFGLSGIKLAGVTFLGTLILGGVAGGWWHIKQMTELKTEHRIETQRLRDNLAIQKKAAENLEKQLAERRKVNERLRKQRRAISNQLEELKNENSEARVYLNTAIPGVVREQTRTSICSLLPSSCELDEGTSAPSAQNEDE